MKRTGMREGRTGRRRPSTAEVSDWRQAPVRGRLPGATSARPLPSPGNQTRCDLIDKTAAIANEAIDGSTLGLSVELIERQRQTIDSIRRATVAALELAEAVDHAEEAAEAVRADRRGRAERAIALHNIAQGFFCSAMALIGATASAGSATRGFDAAVLDVEEPGWTSPALTLRQRRVLGLLLGGLPNKLIAYELGVTEATVKAHVSQVLHKFHVHSRAQVIARLSGRTGLERLN